MAGQTRPSVGLDVRLTYYTGGGIARYIRHLAADLPGLDPHLAFTHFYRRGHSATFSAQARRVDCWTPAHHRFERLALAAEIWPSRLDLLHSPDFIPPQAGYRRSLITVHDLTFLIYPEFLTPDSRHYYNDQIRWAVRHSSAIAADSQATKADLVRLLDVAAEKVTVIPLGLEPIFTPAPLDSQQSAGAPPVDRHGLTQGYVLFVGTFEPRKNVGGLLTAYARLRQEWQDAPQLVLAGRRGWLFESTLRQMNELKLGGHVQVLGDVEEQELPGLYRRAGLFILPSFYEGFGFTVLEAMGCGIPAVIANRASLPEIAGDAALAVDPDDVEAIADALYRGLTDSTLRQSLIGKGLARATQFTWQNTARATLDLYRRVLGS